MTTVSVPRTASTRRPARLGALMVLEYRLRNMWKWKRAIIAYGVGNPVLYLAAIGLGVGMLVDANSGDAGVGGVPYLVFLAPALLATATVQGGQDEAMFPTLSGFIWDRFFYAMRATSLTGGQIAVGVLLAAVVRVTFTAIVYWIVLLAFGAVDWASAPGLLFVSIAAGTCWAAFVMAITAGVRNEDGFMAVFSRVFVMPMFLFSGTFYPLDALPLAVRWIGWISPLWHATVLGRWVSYGASLPTWQLFVSIGYLLTLGSVGVVVARRRFERRLTA